VRTLIAMRPAYDHEELNDYIQHQERILPITKLANETFG